MFCNKCGKEIPENSVVCINCGAPISSDEIEPIEIKPKGIKINKKLIVTIGVIVVLVIGLTVGYSYLKKQASPENFALDYIKCVASNDVGKAYSMLDLPDDVNLSQDCYANIIVNQTPKILAYALSNGTLPSASVSDNFSKNATKVETADVVSDNMVINIEVQEDGSPTTKVIQVNLIKSGKKFFFFDNYKVSTADMIVKDKYITANMFAKVTLDGLDISNYIKPSTSDSTSSYLTYIIPYMFVGTHDIIATHPFLRSDEKNVLIDSHGLDIQMGYDTTSTEFNTMITSKAEELYSKILTAGVTRKDFSTVSDLYHSKDIDSAKTSYAKFVAYNTTSTGAGVSNFKISGNSTTKVLSSDLLAKIPTIIISVTPYFSCDWIQYTKGGGGYTHIIPPASKGTVFFSYTDGAWVMTGISLANILDTPAIEY